MKGSINAWNQSKIANSLAHRKSKTKIDPQEHHTLDNIGNNFLESLRKPCWRHCVAKRWQRTILLSKIAPRLAQQTLKFIPLTLITNNQDIEKALARGQFYYGKAGLAAPLITDAQAHSALN